MYSAQTNAWRYAVNIKCSRLASVLFHGLEATALVDDCRVELLVKVGRVFLAMLGPEGLDGW
eukprot:923956-Pyramimonas_sp.AAC.1